MPDVRLAATGMDSCPASDEDTEDELESARRNLSRTRLLPSTSRQLVRILSIIIFGADIIVSFFTRLFSEVILFVQSFGQNVSYNLPPPFSSVLQRRRTTCYVLSLYVPVQ